MDTRAETRKPQPGPREEELVQAALQALRDHGIPAERVRPGRDARPHGADATVRLKLGGKRVAFAVEVKRWLTPATLGNAVARVRKGRQDVLLVTDYAAPAVAERLRALNVPFADAAGNAYLNRPPVFVWVTGRKPATVARPPRAGRAFQPIGLKLIFALLCRPELADAPLRHMAAFAGVAHGTAGQVITELRELGYLVEHGHKRARVRRFRDRRKLFTEWTETYARILRPQLLIARYQAPDLDWWREIDPTKYDALLGAEPAAAIATGYLRPGVVTLYVEGMPGRLIADYRLRTAGAEANVEIRRRFWPFDYGWDYPALTPPVLIYADLMATGDGRCIETAEILYERHLARFFEEA